MVTFIAYCSLENKISGMYICTCTFIEKFKLRRRNTCIFLAYEFVLERNERPNKELFMSYNALFAGQGYVCEQNVCNMQK